MLPKNVIFSLLLGLFYPPTYGGILMNTEKSIVRLSDEERQELQSIVKKLKGTSQKANRAIALLHADASVQRSCRASGTNRLRIRTQRHCRRIDVCDSF